MTLDLTKPVQTRDGRPARVICTDRRHPLNRPVVALIGSEECIASYHSDGTVGHDSPMNLVNVPTKHEGWMNIVVNAAGEPCPDEIFYETRAEAEKATLRSWLRRVACVHVEWEQPT